MDYIDLSYNHRVRPHRQSRWMWVAIGFALMLVIIAFALPRFVYGDRCLDCMGAGRVLTEVGDQGLTVEMQCPSCRGKGQRLPWYSR